MKKISIVAICSTLFLIAPMGGCKAQGQQAAPPADKVKNAYFAVITCQGNEARGKFDEAERYCKMGIRELEGYTHPLLEPLNSALIDIYLRRGQYEAAEKLQKEQIDITAKTMGKDSPNYAIALAAYGSSMVRNGNFLAGKPYIMEAIPILKNNARAAQSLAGGYWDWYQSALNGKAMVQVSQFHDTEALATLKDWNEYKGKRNPLDSELKSSLAKIYAEVGEVYYHLEIPNIPKARAFYEKALSLNKQADSQNPRAQRNAKLGMKTVIIPEYGIVMAGHNLVAIYQKAGLVKQASALACSLKSWDAYYKVHPPLRAE